MNPISFYCSNSNNVIFLLHTRIRCTASNSSWKAVCFNRNSMQCIESLLKQRAVQREFQRSTPEFDALHRIPVERTFVSTGIRCSASNSRWKVWNSMHCIEFPLKNPSFNFLKAHDVSKLSDPAWWHAPNLSTSSISASRLSPPWRLLQNFMRYLMSGEKFFTQTQEIAAISLHTTSFKPRVSTPIQSWKFPTLKLMIQQMGTTLKLWWCYMMNLFIHVYLPTSSHVILIL